ncbi:MAG: ABC transporter substrate-binding protein [Candidatus Neomarinimicrobiota bacterium]
MKYIIKIRPKFSQTAVVGLTLLLLLAVACGAAATPQPQATSPPTEAAAPTTAPVSAAPTATPKPAATPAAVAPARLEQLTIALSAMGTEGVDPILSILDDKPYTRLMFNYLIDTDLADKEVSAGNSVAESWEWENDMKDLRVVLRKGMKYHDGSVLKAEDVVFSLDRLHDPESRVPYADNIWGPQDAKTTTIEIVSDNELVFHLDAPSIVFIPGLGPILGGSEGFVYSKSYFDEVGVEGFRKKPIGSGPYMLADSQVGLFRELEAFDDYFLGAPKIGKIKFIVVPEESTRIAMLKSGDADLIEASRERSGSLAADGYNLFKKTGGDVITLMPHEWPSDTAGVFLDERVRKALMTSINLEEINEFLLSGQGILTGNWLVEGIGFGSKTIPPHPYDPDAAAQLLRDSGYGEGDLEITLYVAKKTSFPEAEDVGQAILADWEKIGVKGSMVAQDYGTLRPGIVDKSLDTPSMRIHGWSSRAMHSSILNLFFGCPQEKAWSICHDDAGQKIELLKEANTIEEYGDRQQAVAESLVDNHLASVLFVIGGVFASNDKVTDWDMGATAYELNFRYLALKGLLD